MRDPKHARLLMEAAQRDLRALEGMQDPATFADEIFGFHAQQAAEKLLKAWLAVEGVVFPKTHDLRLLLALLDDRGLDMAPFRGVMDYLPFAVGLRYEGVPTDTEPLDRTEAIRRIQHLLDHVRRIMDDVEGA